jgi:hypothetical protein
LEEWNIGMMEEWKDGISELWHGSRAAVPTELLVTDC